jgi:hypothetical protein
MTLKGQLDLTTQSVLDAHEAHLPKDVRWERRGLLGRLTRSGGESTLFPVAPAGQPPLDRAP